MKAWHFLKNNRKLRWNWKCVVKPGNIYRVNPNKLEICKYGLHASLKPLDALTYAPGTIICRVKLQGKILKSYNKICGEYREVLWMADATKCLHEFALWCARNALIAEKKAGREPDKRCWAALIIKKKWLNGKTTEKELGTARHAARYAAQYAAESAVQHAAWSTAESAARHAARYAAWSTAEYAARHAARYAAQYAAESAARYVAWSNMESAAQYAAESAAESAAKTKQNNKFYKMLMKLEREE